MSAGSDLKQSGTDGRITVRYVENIAVLQLDRGENRVNADFIEKINQALDEIEKNPDVKALVTTGTDKYFSNGLDLDWLTPLNSKYPVESEKFRQELSALEIRVLTFPVPTVAAINGHAFAYGAFLALAHDYRVMRSDRGWFSINEVHLGLRLNAMLLELVRTKIPSSGFTDVLIFGKRLTGPESKAAGFVNEVTTQENLIPTALKMAKNSLPKNGIPRQNLKGTKMDLYNNIVEAEKLIAGGMPGKL